MSSVTLGELQKVGRIINDNLIGEPPATRRTKLCYWYSG